MAVGPPPSERAGSVWRAHTKGELFTPAGAVAEPTTEVELVGDDA
ncbi:MAG TPA: hypothetical protein VLX59_06450 [Acidimicrobiales bacterium]|nr:hypothetical protein [Acidimicrobiales bacterium]